MYELGNFKIFAYNITHIINTTSIRHAVFFYILELESSTNSNC
jgi:hypothetical protein